MQWYVECRGAKLGADNIDLEVEESGLFKIMHTTSSSTTSLREGEKAADDLKLF